MQSPRDPVWTSAPVAYITTLTSQLTIGPPMASHTAPAASIPTSPPPCDMDESLARLSLRASNMAPHARGLAPPRATAAATTTSATALAAPAQLDDEASRGRDAATAAAELLRHLMPPPAAPFTAPSSSSSRPMPAAGSRRTFSITETPSNSPSGPTVSKFAPPSKRHHRSTSEDALSTSSLTSSLSTSPQHPSVALFGSAPLHDDATDDHELSFLVGQIEMSDKVNEKHMPYIS